MQANGRHRKMVKEIRRRRKAKLAHSTKRQGLVAHKQQPCIEHWYEQNVVCTAGLLQPKRPLQILTS